MFSCRTLQHYVYDAYLKNGDSVVNVLTYKDIDRDWTTPNHGKSNPTFTKVNLDIQ